MLNPLETIKTITQFRSSPSSAMRALWGVLKGVPGGGRVMGEAVGRMAPYSGTIHPEILDLEPGRARVRMSDTPRVRNHLRSVHAIALMNLGEVSTGTAVLVSTPDDARAIIVELRMEYLKKARGKITADCKFEIPENLGLEKQELLVQADLTDAEGAVVARAHAKWLVSPPRRD